MGVDEDCVCNDPELGNPEEVTVADNTNRAETTSNFRDVVTEGSSDGFMRELSSLTPVNEDEASSIIASNMDNELTSNAKILNDHVVKYNKLMSELTILRREISRLSSPLDANPTINSIREAITRLNGQDNIVESAFLTTSYLVVRTHEIITEELSNGVKYKVGNMEFFINMKF